MTSRGGITALVLVVAAIVLVYTFLGGGQYTSFVSIPNGGVTILGLSQVAVLSNVAGFAGNYWLATVKLGGAQSLNVQASASQFAPNSSFICNSACQSDNLQISANYNYLLYPASSSGTPIDDYFITTLGGNAPVTLTYNTCINGPLIGTSGMPSTTSLSSQNVTFSPCLNSAAEQQAYVNYYASCSSSGGTPLVVHNNGGTTIVIGTGFFGIPITFGAGSTVGCFSLQGEPYAYVYSVGSAIPNYQVQVKFNGITSTISNIQQSNISNKNLLLFNVGYGSGVQQPPSEQFSLVAQEPISLPQYGISTSSTAVTIASASAGTLQSITSSIQGSLQSQFGSSESIANATKFVSAADLGTSRAIVNATANNPALANASILTGSGTFINGQGILGVKLNDPLMIYTRPQIQMAINATKVGIYLGVSSFKITSVNMVAFRSGSFTNAYVTVQNVGTASGGYSLTSTSSQSAVSFNPGSYQNTETPGQQQVVSITVSDNAQITSNTTQNYQFTVCPSPNPTGSSSCNTVSGSFTLVPQCNSNQQFNSGTCQTLTTISAPTTSVPQGVSTALTTIPPVCNPSNLTGACAGNPNTGIPWYYYVAGVAIVAVVAYALSTRKSSGSRGTG